MAANRAAYGVPELRDALDRYRATLPRPLLEPAWALPDPPDPTQPRWPLGTPAA
jgi:hypothetical protein